MEGIEDLATGILRTGKLGLQGEPGGMVLTIDVLTCVVYCKQFAPNFVCVYVVNVVSDSICCSK